ncbi:MAG: helix-turn-helix domain-containing protein [Pseudolabrys sp.]
MPNDSDGKKGPLPQGVSQAVPHSIREVVKAVAELEADTAGSGVTVAALAQKLGLEKSSASSLAKDAIKRGYLRNLEDTSGRRARLVLNDPLPSELDHETQATKRPIEGKPETLDIKAASLSDRAGPGNLHRTISGVSA